MYILKHRVTGERVAFIPSSEESAFPRWELVYNRDEIHVFKDVEAVTNLLPIVAASLNVRESDLLVDYSL